MLGTRRRLGEKGVCVFGLRKPARAELSVG